MKSFQRRVTLCLAMLAVCSGATAQAVYRCGSSYSQIPCAGAVPVQADDSRSEAQRAAAREGLARDKALAKDMEASRRKDEAQALELDKAALAQAAAAHKQTEKKPSGKKAVASKKRTAKIPTPEFFTATDGKTIPKKKPAHKP